ncbi:MAG: polysaccharide deacetylase family protein [Phenylobacterium sp.]
MGAVLKSLCAALVLLCAASPARAVEIAMTFDDLPAHASLPPGMTRLAVVQGLLAALKQVGAPPVYGFVNGVRIVEEPDSADVLPAWRSAGQPLGNHGFSHLDLNSHAASDFITDLLRDEPLLRQQMGETGWRWFRYPYLSEGDTPAKRAEVRGVLAANGYRIAAVTLSFDDWAFSDAYVRCEAKGDTAAVADMERKYLAAAEASLAYSRAMSQALFGRDIPYVLLMHASAFDVRMLPRLLALYRTHRVRLVTLEAAQRDRFYVDDNDPARPQAAPVTLESEMGRRGLPIPPKGWSISELDGVCR